MPPEAPTLEPPQVQAPTSSPTMDAFDSTFADLDTAPAAAPTPEPTPAPTPTPDRPKDPATGKFVAKTEKSEEPPKPTTPEVVKAPEKPSEGTPEYQPPMVAKPSELKRWAQKMGDRAQTAEQQLSKLNSRLRELESKPSESVDVKALTDELANTKKRLEEYEGELKVTRYERSGEYKENYEKPYQETVKKAYRKVAELVIREPVKGGELDEHGKPTQFNEREATPADLDAVYYAGNPMSRRNKAKELFGEDWQSATALCDQIREKQEAALEAVQANKGKAQEYEQQQTAQQKMLEEGRSRMFGEAIKAITDKYKDLFGEREGDSTWNDNLHKGRSMADLAYGDRKGLNPQQNAILDAQVHARISGFPALLHEYQNVKSQLADSQKEVAELRGSAPGKGTPAAPKTEEPSNLTMDQAFDKFVP